ncbi:MAG TPA: SH3 domain-containing protein [Verrucomicrobiae bacterium]|nr:SH3 domain-containing protein [Verrucomicrobiae bacterium]
MKKWTNLHNFRRQIFVLSALAVAASWIVSATRADSGGAVPAVAAPVSETGRGTIKGQHSNVRSRPSLSAEVVTQLHKGETVDVLDHKTVTEREKSVDWLRIALPAAAKCYVSAKHLTGGAANVENLNVRCGPGSNYRDVGKLSKGTKVEVVEKKGEWVQIRPTPECSGWIAAELVDVEAAPRAAAPPASTSEVVTPPVAASPIPAPAAPAVSVVNADPDILVTYVVKDGYLAAVNEPNAPATFELRTTEADRLSFRIAYLETSETNLKRFEGKHVRVVGTQRWRKGERYPVIAIERIDMVW